MKHLSLLSALMLASSCLQPVSEDAGSDTIELAGYCDAWVEQRFCTNLKTCGRADPTASCSAIDRLPGGRRCVGCIPYQLLAIDAGFLTYDGKAAKRCFEETSRTCDAPLDCTDIFVGHRALGESCITSMDCIDGACASSGTCLGTCVPRSKLGERPVGGCEEGLSWVTQQDGGSRCALKVGHDEPCEEPGDLSNGTRCAEPGEQCWSVFDGGVSRCGSYPYPPGAKRGEPCTAGSCQRGLACQADGGCGDIFQLGAECFSDFTGCVTDARCVSGFQSGTCLPLGGEGTSCQSFGSCRSDSSCIDSTCRRSHLEGESCATREECVLGLECNDGRCGGPVCR